MAREIKFKRAHFNSDGIFLRLTEWGFVEGGFSSPNVISGEDRKKAINLQFTGLKDKNDVHIYEGHIIRFREPYRSHQTHVGDNIPNGSYTEAMEPLIRTIQTDVFFDEGSFMVSFERNDDNGHHNYEMVWPLEWTIREYDEESIKSNISTGRDPYDEWDGEDGNKQWFLEEYKLGSVEELIAYCSGVEVIGNIYQNPELLIK